MPPDSSCGTKEYKCHQSFTRKLKLGHKPTNKRALGKTPLICATLLGDENIVGLLLESKSDINFADNKGKTALIWAAENNIVNVVNRLLRGGADANIKESNGNWEVVGRLLKGGAKVYRDHLFRCTLLEANKDDASSETIKTILNAGVDLNFHKKLEGVYLVSAVRKNREDIVRILQKNGAQIRDSHSSLLEKPILAGNAKLIRLLAEAGVNLKDRTDGKSPLLLALSEEKEESVQALLGLGADINRDIMLDNESYFFNIIKNNREEVLQILLDHGADIRVKNKSGWNTLFMAVLYGNGSIIPMLVKACAYLEESQEGETSLMVAARQGDEESVKALLELGADRKAFDSKGKTAKDHAKQQENIVEILKEWKSGQKEGPFTNHGKRKHTFSKLSNAKELPAVQRKVVGASDEVIEIISSDDVIITTGDNFDC